MRGQKRDSFMYNRFTKNKYCPTDRLFSQERLIFRLKSIYIDKDTANRYFFKSIVRETSVNPTAQFIPSGVLL